MQPAYDLIRRAADRHAHHRPTRFPLLIRGVLPKLLGLRPPKASRLLVAFLVGVLFAAAPAFAHSWNFLPLGWSGPWAGGSTGPTHPEDLCARYPSYACIVGGAFTPTDIWNIGLTRWPIRVTNSQGLNLTYCTNTANTPGWIVVIGITGLSWGFQGLFPPTPECQSVDFRCTQIDPPVASGWASLPWGAGKYYYQATVMGTFWGTTCPKL